MRLSRIIQDFLMVSLLRKYTSSCYRSCALFSNPYFLYMIIHLQFPWRNLFYLHLHLLVHAPPALRNVYPVPALKSIQWIGQVLISFQTLKAGLSWNFPLKMKLREKCFTYKLGFLIRML